MKADCLMKVVPTRRVWGVWNRRSTPRRPNKEARPRSGRAGEYVTNSQISQRRSHQLLIYLRALVLLDVRIWLQTSAIDASATKWIIHKGNLLTAPHGPSWASCALFTIQSREPEQDAASDETRQETRTETKLNHRQSYGYLVAYG